jgi:ubiquinone/menaquinone biosynthesis C-methylase UbiE
MALYLSAALPPTSHEAAPVNEEPLPATSIAGTDPVAVSSANYSSEQVDADAKKLFDATMGGFAGWGTDEDLIWHTLENRSATEVDRIRASFREHYGKGADRENPHYLDDVLRDETSGFDRQHVDALLLGKENRAETDAVVIQSEIDGQGDAQEVLNRLQGLNSSERHDLAAAYARKYGPLPEGQTAEQFLLSKLSTETLEGENVKPALLSGEDLDRATALLNPANGDVAQGEAEADARKIHVGLDGWYKDWGPLGGHFVDQDTLASVFAGKSTEQIKAIETQYQELYGAGLRDRIKHMLRGADEDVALRLLDPASTSSAAASAERLRQAIGGTFTDTHEGDIRKELKGKSAEDIRQIISAYDALYRKQDGADFKGLRERLDDELGGSDNEETLHLLDAPEARDAAGLARWQAEHDAIRLKGAMDGIDVDEDLVREILSGKTKEQITAIETTYNQRYTDQSLRSRLEDELGDDTREYLELLKQRFDRGTVDMKADPRGAIAQKIQWARESLAFEQTGEIKVGDAADPDLSAPLVSGNGVDFTSLGQKILHGDAHYLTDAQRLARSIEESKAALDRYDQTHSDQDLAQAAHLAGFTSDDVQTLIATKNQATHLVATAAEVTAAVVVGTAVSIASGGTASPLMIALVSGLASASAGGATYAVMDPQLGSDQIRREAGIAGLAGATGAARLGTLIPSGLKFATPLATGSVRTAGDITLGSMTREGVVVGAQNGAAVEGYSAAAERSTWDDGLVPGMSVVLMRAGSGAATGAVMGGAGGAAFTPVLSRVPRWVEGASTRTTRLEPQQGSDGASLEPLAPEQLEPLDPRLEGRVVGSDETPGATDTDPPAATDDGDVPPAANDGDEPAIEDGDPWEDYDFVRIGDSDFEYRIAAYPQREAPEGFLDVRPVDIEGQAVTDLVDGELELSPRAVANQIKAYFAAVFEVPPAAAADPFDLVHAVWHVRQSQPAQPFYRGVVIDDSMMAPADMQELSTILRLPVRTSSGAEFHPADFEFDYGTSALILGGARAQSNGRFDLPPEGSVFIHTDETALADVTLPDYHYLETIPDGSMERVELRNIDPRVSTNIEMLSEVRRVLAPDGQLTITGTLGSRAEVLANFADAGLNIERFIHDPGYVVARKLALPERSTVFRPSIHPNAPVLPPDRPISGQRLTIGGGIEFREPAMGEVYFNRDSSAGPHVVGDIRNAHMIPDSSFDEVFFERVQYSLLTGTAPATLREAARIAGPGGRVRIETGSNAYRHADLIKQRMEEAGFANVRIEWVSTEPGSEPATGNGYVVFTGERP